MASSGDGLVVGWGGDLMLRVRVAAPGEVDGVREAHASELSTADSGFAVLIEDLDAALDDMNLLIEVQLTLQAATGGWMFNDWNKTLTGPQ